MKNLLASVAFLLAAIVVAPAQVTLSGTSYTQNFNSIGSGLPPGWTVRTGATASSLGNVAAFLSAATPWGTQTGNFRNGAGAIGNNGLPLNGNEDPSDQNNMTNRAVAVRQTGSWGDPGGAFVFQIENTLGYADFELSLDFLMLNVQPRSTTWRVDYGLGSNPTSFVQVGTTYTDPGEFGSTTRTVVFPPEVNDQAENLWIRVVALSASTGSGNRDTFGIDNFHLTFSPAIAPSGPPVISESPASQTVWQGTNVTFTVSASGAAPLSYQWYNDGGIISGATQSAYTISNVTTNHSGSYHVVVGNSEDSVESEAATLTVQAPIVTTIAYLRSLVDTQTWLPPESDTLYQIQGGVINRGNLANAGDAAFYMHDGTAGIAVYVRNAPFPATFEDKVTIVGPLSHFNGLLQMTLDLNNPTHRFIIYADKIPPPEPITLPLSTQYDIAAIEALEGSLVVITNVFVERPTTGFVPGTTYSVTNAFNLAETFQLSVDPRITTLNGINIPVGVATIVGVLGQYSTSDPRTNGYQILPTFYEDVYPGPSINTHPQSQTVLVGEPIQLTVSASPWGGGSLQYQWRKNGQEIPGATTSAFTINEAAISDTGRYSVWVYTSYGINPSAEAFVSVGDGSVSVLHYNVQGLFSPDFSAGGDQVQAIGRQLSHLQPDVITLNEIPVGKTYVVTNIVNDFLPGYFWATNSGSDGNARSVILSRWKVLRSQSWLDDAPLDSYGYSGNFTRDLFEAEIEVPGFIQPLHVFTTHLKSGQTAEDCLRRAAEAGAISNFFVNGFLTTNAGRPYILTGDLNEDIDRPPLHSQQPVQRLRNAQTGLQLLTPVNPITQDERTHPAGSPANRYDYILPSSSLSAQIATSMVFRTSVMSPLPEGLNANDDTTASDHLPVLARFGNPSFVPPIVISHPKDVTVALGGSASFSVEVASASQVTYIWKRDGEPLADGGNISGATTASLLVSPVGELDAGVYSVEVINEYGSATSNEATLFIAQPPVVTVQPIGSTNIVGTIASFTVEVTGTEPFGFQWKKGGTPLSSGGRVSGANTATLTLSNLQEEDSGVYLVTVTNIAGSVDSQAVELSVLKAPTITSHPASQTVSEGQGFTLAVSANGTAPLSYQWHLKTEAITDATNSTYSVGSAGAGDGGDYYVVVANGAGAVTSSVATVRVALSQTIMSAANLVVLRAGDGVQSLGNTGNSVYLDQYTTTGDYVSTMAVPDSGTAALIINGSATAEGALSLSADGRYLTFVGYSTNRPASGNVSNFSPAQVPRAVGQVDAAGQYEIAAQTTTVYNGSFRSAVSDGANNYWGAGANNGTYYLGNESTPANVQNSIANTRVVNSFNGNLYFSTGSGTRGIHKFEGMPTSSASATLLVGTGGSSSPYGFAINADETVVYIADDSAIASGGGVQRWDKVDETWVLSYRVGTNYNSGVRGLAVSFDGDHPVIYATTAETTGNRLIRIVDEGPGSGATILASAGAGQVFRGVQFGPSQELPAIVDHPQPLHLLQGELAAFTVTVSNGGSLSYQWLKNGLPIQGATLSSFTIAAVTPEDAGLYSVTVSNLLGGVTSDEAELTVVADPIPPVLKVLSPKNKSIHTTDSLLIHGTARETVQLTSVQYELNGSGFLPAELEFVAVGKASNWNTMVNLQPGTNFLTVVATDLAGNESTVGPIQFFYHVGSPFTIQTNLNGVVIHTNGVGAVVHAPPLSLQANGPDALFVGRTYKLKAVETGKPYFILTNWTATWDGQDTPVVIEGNNLECVFEMKSNMVINANFIDNPFYYFGGLYHGLFYNVEDGVTHTNAGYLSMKVTPKLTFSAKLMVGGDAVSLSGKLNIDGTGTASSKSRMKKSDRPELTIDLAIDFEGASDTVSGTVSQGTDWTAQFVADRMVWSKTNANEQAHAFINSYTMLLPGFTNRNDGPIGSGSALVTINPLGKVKVSGVGADMEKAQQSTYVSKHGQIPFYAPMYAMKRTNLATKTIKETRGMIMGWLTLETNEMENLRPAGEVHWIKTAGWTNSPLYADGFENVTNVTGSRWYHDKLNPQLTLAPQMPCVELEFSGGDFDSPFSNVWLVDTNKSTFKGIKFPKPHVYTYENTVKASVATKTGLFKGTFIHPETPLAKTKFQGVILQDENYGEGAFMGITEGGKVTLTPLLEPPAPESALE